MWKLVSYSVEMVSYSSYLQKTLTSMLSMSRLTMIYVGLVLDLETRAISKKPMETRNKVSKYIVLPRRIQFLYQEINFGNFYMNHTTH